MLIYLIHIGKHVWNSIFYCGQTLVKVLILLFQIWDTFKTTLLRFLVLFLDFTLKGSSQNKHCSIAEKYLVILIPSVSYTWGCNISKSGQKPQPTHQKTKCWITHQSGKREELLLDFLLKCYSHNTIASSM